MTQVPRFHLAFPVTDLVTTRMFYTQTLGCRVGRESQRWIDFDFFGHQISAHLVDDPSPDAACNPVDGALIPVRHFGLILEKDQWQALVARLRESGAEFVIEPVVRFRGGAGEQGTFFIRDPSGNHLEFKTFNDMAQIFARRDSAE